MMESSMDMGAPMMESSMGMDSDSNENASWGDHGSSGSADFQCLPYFFLTGVEAGSSNGCWNGRVLSSISDPTCTVKCMSGYSGSSGTITCDSNGLLSEDITCTENVPMMENSMDMDSDSNENASWGDNGSFGFGGCEGCPTQWNGDAVCDMHCQSCSHFWTDNVFDGGDCDNQPRFGIQLVRKNLEDC